MKWKDSGIGKDVSCATYNPLEQKKKWRNLDLAISR